MNDYKIENDFCMSLLDYYLMTVLYELVYGLEYIYCVYIAEKI